MYLISVHRVVYGNLYRYLGHSSNQQQIGNMVISVRGEPIWGLWALIQIMCLVIANYLFVFYVV